KGDEESLA
nr:delicious taste peptide [Bos taurus]